MALVQRRRRSGLGAVRGDINPTTGQVFDGATWVTPNDGESQTLSDAYKSYMGDPFVNMTEEQKALYWAGQGGKDLAYFSPGVTAGQYDATAQAANAAATAAALATRADEVAALTRTVQTAQAADLTQRNATTAAANDAQLRADIRAHLASIIAAGGVFADTIPAGTLYQASFLKGMLTTQQWMDDQFSLARGGLATNTIAQAGKIPAGVTSAEAYAQTHPALPRTSGGASSAASGSAGGPGGGMMTEAGSALDANASGGGLPGDGAGFSFPSLGGIEAALGGGSGLWIALAAVGAVVAFGGSRRKRS